MEDGLTKAAGFNYTMHECIFHHLREKCNLGKFSQFEGENGGKIGQKLVIFSVN